MRVLVVGLGEVGSAIYEIIRDAKKFEVYGYDIDPSRTKNSLEEIPEHIDIIHICIPFSNKEKFIDIVKSYSTKYKPKLTIVHSTVEPGTTRSLSEVVNELVAYSPVRGKHPYLVEHIRFWPKWVASTSKEGLKMASEHLKELGLKVKEFDGSPETLELAKILETVYRGLLIAWWQETHRIARHFGADIKTITEFIGEIHEVLHDKPPMYPGFIGGHCVIPNTEILARVYKSKFLEAILESNKKRAEELKDPEIKKEVEELKELVKKYIVREYYEGKIPKD